MLPLALSAQDNPWIFKVGDETVYADEFMRVFSKNNDLKENPPTKESVEEYLDLYVKFKLKVKEAYAREMDTVQSFQDELAGYRKQLAQPYLTDKTITENLIDEAYSRMINEVNASHILINCELTASPADTLKAYRKIMDIRKKIMDGMSFSEAATAFSEDPSAKVNQGNLGWFSAFQMIYPFETAAFTTPVDEVSQPVRTRFGYHLVKVNAKEKSQGEMKAAHIMIRFNNESEIEQAKEKIDAIYAKLKAGESFEDLVKQYTQDFSTRGRNGELSWFKRTSSNVPLTFREAAFTLKEDGDYSEPFKTRYGWHIVKRIEVKELASKDELKESIKRKIQRDSRSELNRKAVVARVKEENNFKAYRVKWKKLNGYFDSSLLAGTWELTETKKDKKKLFKIDDVIYTWGDFFEYVNANQRPVRNQSIPEVTRTMYDQYVADANLDYEEAILEKKYPEFRYIMQEYRDGILLFELTDEEVWSKSVQDTAGLDSFYQHNKDRYTWKPRLYFSQYICKDSASAAKAKAMIAEGMSDSAIVATLNSSDPLTISITRKRVEKGTDPRLDMIPWEKGVYDLVPVSNNVEFVVVYSVLEETVKPKKETLGALTSDYQEYLENQWIEELRAKYPVTINQEGVESLYQ
jgi:peptidyl-prolyl cis-trans isomerase SurA